MDIRKVKKLIELLEESGISEIDITEGDDAVRISRYPSALYPPPVPAATVAPSVTTVTGAQPPGAGGETEETTAVPVDGHVVTAPMVGTFYASPAPGAKPFVQVGSEVQVGDTLCIIEAMKIMNPIDAEMSGVIKEVCVQDAQPVEFGQVLFRVDPNG